MSDQRHLPADFLLQKPF